VSLGRQQRKLVGAEMDGMYAQRIHLDGLIADVGASVQYAAGYLSVRNFRSVGFEKTNCGPG
jgi:hypothetical protein